MNISKSRKRILNSAGIAAQQGKLGDAIEMLSRQNENLLQEIENIGTLLTVTCTFYMWTRPAGMTTSDIRPCDVIDANSIPEPITVQYGTCVPKPNDPTGKKDGLGFVCWVDENGAKYDFACPLKRNITLSPRIGYNEEAVEVVEVEVVEGQYNF